MSTLQADIDDLDRMVDCSAAKDEIRAQIRLISRGVAALEAADYARLEEIARFSETIYIRHLTERHDMSVSQLITAFEKSNSIQDLCERIKAIPKRSEACQYLRLERCWVRLEKIGKRKRGPPYLARASTMKRS